MSGSSITLKPAETGYYPARKYVGGVPYATQVAAADWDHAVRQARRLGLTLETTAIRNGRVGDRYHGEP